MQNTIGKKAYRKEINRVLKKFKKNKLVTSVIAGAAPCAVNVKLEPNDPNPASSVDGVIASLRSLRGGLPIYFTNLPSVSEVSEFNDGDFYSGNTLWLSVYGRIAANVYDRLKKAESKTEALSAAAFLQFSITDAKTCNSESFHPKVAEASYTCVQTLTELRVNNTDVNDTLQCLLELCAIPHRDDVNFTLDEKGLLSFNVASDNPGSASDDSSLLITRNGCLMRVQQIVMG